MQQAESLWERHAFVKEFAFPGDLAALPVARDTMLQFLGEHGIGGEVEIDWMIALQEALANAALHGCGNDPAKTIHSTVEIGPEHIEIVIQDPGPGFDASCASDSAEDGTNLTQHGRGILLMRSLMDEVSYRHNGAELHMRKRRCV